jgi:chemotaxis protein methyltransferase CheR
MMGEASKSIKFVPPEIRDVAGLKISSKEFETLRNLIRSMTGINLNEQKVSLMQSRLSKRLRQLNMSSFQEYIDYLVNQDPDSEMPIFINSLTTNKTDFMREEQHFHYLKEVLQQSPVSGTKYIWSAACSTGAEVYTLALVLEDLMLQKAGLDYRILGTDIDTSVLQKASDGIYSKYELDPVNPFWIKRHFYAGKGAKKNLHKISDEIKKKIKFRQYNLISQDNRLEMKFDIIFLRNVLIYFERDTIEKVIASLTENLKPGGLLFIGHSENLNSISHDLKYVGMSIYQKVK